MNNGNGSRRPPTHLSRETKRWWKIVSDRYELEEHHYRLLELAGTCWDRITEARATLKAEGMTIDGRFGKKVHPAANIEKDNKLLFIRTIRELNLSETPDDARPPRLGYGR